MRRPLPTIPRGSRRQSPKPAAPRRLLLSCPRVSPEWELGALRALMKPHDWTRGAIAHRPALQPWSRLFPRRVEEAAALVMERLQAAPPPALHFPGGGDFWFLVEATESQADTLKALAVVLSKRLPGVWVTLDRLYVRDGGFFRRKRDNTFKFRLVPSTSVHLPRAVRAALRGLV